MFRMARFRFSVQRPAVLAKVFVIFLGLLADAGIEPNMDHDFSLEKH
jgi:hypothetical protein